MFFFESLGTGSDSEPSFFGEPNRLQKLWNRPSLTHPHKQETWGLDTMQATSFFRDNFEAKGDL